jgi:hypothetical protein
MAVSRSDVGLQVALQLAPGLRLVASLENVNYPWEQSVSTVGTVRIMDVTLPARTETHGVTSASVKLPALTGTAVLDVSTNRNSGRTKLASVHLRGPVEGAEGAVFEFQSGKKATAVAGSIEVWVSGAGAVEWSGRLVARVLASGGSEVVVINLQGSAAVRDDTATAPDHIASVDWNLTVITAGGGAAVMEHCATNDAFLIDMTGADARQLLKLTGAAGSHLPAAGCKHLMGVLRIAGGGEHLSAERIAVPVWGEHGTECWPHSNNPVLAAGDGGVPLKLNAVAPRLAVNGLVLTHVSIRADVLPVDAVPITWNIAAVVEGRLALSHPATAASLNLPPYSGWARATVPAWITGDDLDGLTTGAVSVDARITLAMGGGGSRQGLWIDVGAKLSAPCTAPVIASGMMRVAPDGLGFSLDIEVTATLPCLHAAAEAEAAVRNNLVAAPVVVKIEPRSVRGMGGVELPAHALTFGTFDSPVDLQATWSSGADGIAWRWAGTFGVEEGPNSVLPFKLNLKLSIDDVDSTAPTASLAIELTYTSDEIAFYLAGLVPIGDVLGGECKAAGGLHLHGDLKLKLLSAEAGDVSPTRFDVSAIGHCEDDDGVTVYVLSAIVRDWNIVDGLLVMDEGTAYVTVARKTGDTTIGNITGHIAGTVSKSGRNSEASEIPPIFDFGVNATLKFTSDAAAGFRIGSFELVGDISIAFGDADALSGTYVNAQGTAHMVYPCKEGNKFTAAVDLTARAGSMTLNGLRAALVYYCGPVGGGGGSTSRPSGDETSSAASGEMAKHYPVLDIVAEAEGPVSFIEGVSLNDFVLNLTALRSVKRLDAVEGAQRLNSTGDVLNRSAHAAFLGGEEQKKDEWYFVGNVRGLIALGEGSTGATVMYVLDTRTGAWGVATQLVFMSDALNATLSIATVDALTDCGIEDAEDDVSVNVTLLRRTTMHPTREDQSLPPQPATIDGEISLRLGNGFLKGDAAGEYRCKDKHEYHIAVSVEEAFIPLMSSVTVTLENVLLVVDGYKKLETDVERGESEKIASMEVTYAALGAGNASSNANANAASAKVPRRSNTDPRRLDWKVHVEGTGTVELSGASHVEDNFFSSSIGTVNMSLEAHTDVEDGRYVLDTINMHGDILIQTPQFSLYGGVELHLPCGAFPGPMISGTVTADINVGELALDAFDIDVDYYCAEKASDAVEVHARARIDSITLQGVAGLTLSDVEVNFVATQKLVPPPSASPASPNASQPPPSFPPATTSAAPKPPPPPPASHPPPPVFPPPPVPVVLPTATCCNAHDAKVLPSGGCCNPGTLHVQSGEQCMSTRWCKAGGMACATAAGISSSKRCATHTATARHLLNTSDSDNEVTEMSIEWALKGFVKGRSSLGNADDAVGELIVEAVFVFDTNDNSWEVAVGYSLDLDGFKLSLMGEAASPCEANTPTELTGSLELKFRQVHMVAGVSAAHWCEADATTRLEVNASVPVLDILSTSLQLTDVLVTWRALSRGKPAGTPLAQLRQSGEIRGLVSTDFGVNSDGTVLALAAEVSLAFLYSPVHSQITMWDPLLDLEVSIIVDGVMPAGGPPMLDAVISGRYAPMQEEPAEGSGTGTIRLPGLGKNDPIAELQIHLCTRLWGSHIAPAIRQDRVLEFSATMIPESSTGSIYGFTINKLSAVATFMSPPNVLAGLRGDDEDKASATEGEEVDEQSEPETNTMHEHIKAAYAVLGATIAKVDESTNVDTTATSPASFPALKFDLADTMGTIDIFADVELSTENVKEALSALPDGLDAAARVVWRGQLTRASGAKSQWALAKSELAVAVGISFTSESLNIELNGEVSTTCTPDGPRWALNGTTAIPALNLNHLTSAEYECDTRRLNVTFALASMRVPFINGFSLDARDIVVSIEAVVERFPGENITSDDALKDNDENLTATATFGQALDQTDAGNTAFTGQADILWNVTAQGVIFLEQGMTGMPDLDCEAFVTIVMSNHMEYDVAFADFTSKDGRDAEVDVEENDPDIVSIDVNVSIAYALDGVALAGSAQFAWPCLDIVTGDASVVFDADRTGISASSVTASIAVSCAGNSTPPGTPFVEFIGTLEELQITNAIIVELLHLRIVGMYTADGATRWLITLSAMSASPSTGPAPQAAPGAMEPAGSLYWSVDITLHVQTPSPLEVEKVGRENAPTAYKLAADASVSYVTSVVEFSAEGRLRLGVCEPDIPRMYLDGNVSVTLPGDMMMPLYGTLSVECVDPEKESVTVGDDGFGPNEDLNIAEGNIPTSPKNIRYTNINITAGADAFEIVSDVLRVDYMHANASIRIPSSDADEVPTQMQGFAMGKATLIGPLPGVEGIDLEGTVVEFNVSFSTDTEGDMKLDKFHLHAQIEIKYFIGDASSEDGPSAALLGTHEHRFGSNLGVQSFIPALGGSSLPNIHARGYVALQYPCVLGQDQRMDLSLALSFGDVAIPDMNVRFVYHCEQEGSKLPAFTAKGIHDTPSRIAETIELEGFSIVLSGFRINDVMEYRGLLDGRLSLKTSGDFDAQVMFQFDTVLGRYGFAFRISFSNEYIRAELAGRLSDTDECSVPSNNSDMLGMHVEDEFDATQDFIMHPLQFGNATGNATGNNTLRDMISGEIQINLPGMAEILVNMHGWMECAVVDASMPMIQLQAWIAEIRVQVSKDFELIVKRVGIRLRGFRDPVDANFTLTSPGDFKKLAFRARIQGTVSLKLSKGMPELGAGFSGGSEAAEKDFTGELDGDAAKNNGVVAKATIIVVWDDDSASVEQAVVEVEVHYQAGPAKRPTFVVDGRAHFQYPCTRGTSIVFLAAAEIDMGVLRMQAAAGVTLFCGNHPNEPVANVDIRIGELTIGDISLLDVEVIADVFNRPKQGFSLAGSIKGRVKAEFGATVDAFGEFVFDTYKNTFRAAVGITFSAGPLDVSLLAGISSGNNCDLINGDYLTGNASITFDDFSVAATVSGVRHCGTEYADYMRNQSATSVPVAPRYAEALLAVIAPAGAIDRFPMCVEPDGLCGPWFGGRVCPAGQYCSLEGQCESAVEMMGRALARSVPPPPSMPASPPPSPNAPWPPQSFPPAMTSAAPKPPPPPPASHSPPPVLPPPPVPVVLPTATCCNAHDAKALPSGGCCNPGTLHVQSGEQCMSTRWCKAGGMACATAAGISSSKRCATHTATARHMLSASNPDSDDVSPSHEEADAEFTALPLSPVLCCHGTGHFDMIKSNDGACCDTRTLTVRQGGVCISSRWCKGESSDSCKEAAKIAPSRTCSEAALGHPTHAARNHMDWRKAHLGAAKAEDKGDADVVAQTLLKYSNNFKGGCSHCSADGQCGPENGGTVCPGNNVCTPQGQCEVAGVDDQPELPDITNPMFRFSNNYGLQCITPGCARAGLCGPSHDNKVCPSGQTCMPSGHCKDSSAAALLGAGDSDTALLSAFSDNHLGACPPRMCALNQRCGPDNFQVCMSGQTCVRGQCMMNYVFEAKRFLPGDVFPDYSDNSRGVCARCAGGHRQVCGGKKRLVCPRQMVCAVTHHANREGDNSTSNFTGTGYDDADCDDAGVCKGDEESAVDPEELSTDSDGRQRTTFTSGSEGATFNEFAKMAGPRVSGATYGKPICLHLEEVDEMDIQEEDITNFDDADQAECARPELISLPVVRNRTVDSQTWAEMPEVVADKGSAGAENRTDIKRKYLVICARAKPGRSMEGAPCGRQGEYIERVCPTWAACLSATAADTAVSAAGDDPATLFSGYNPRSTHVCVSKSALKAAGNAITKKDHYAFPNNDEDLDLDERVCDPDALITRDFVIMEAEQQEYVVLPESDPILQSDSTIPVHFVHLQEPCGPHHGGLVCSDAEMVCAAREGICISATLAEAAQYTVLEEYSRNYAGFADEDTASSIADQRLSALATLPNAGLNVEDVEYRDFPMYTMKLSVSEISLLGGQVKLMGVSLTAYGALVSDPAGGDYKEADTSEDTETEDAASNPVTVENSTEYSEYGNDDEPTMSRPAGHKVPLRDLHWDGEIMGTLAMNNAADSTLPHVEGSFSVAVAWTMPPNGTFDFQPLIARGEVRANFGGNPHAPTVVIRARAAFPVPCDLGLAFRASGSLVMRKLGGSISGALQMSATYFCGQRPDSKLAEFDARLDEPIELAGLLRVTKMTVMGTLFRKPKSEIAEEVEARRAAIGAASKATTDSDEDDDGSDADEEAAMSDGESGDGGGYYTEGVIIGEVEIIGAVEGLSLFASIWFDTGAGAADVFVALRYETPMLVLEAKARIPLGFCDYVGMQMIGTARINAAPMAELTAEARVVKHCEDAAVATERYGHVWLIELNIPHLDVFDGMLVGKDIEVRVIGKQVGSGEDVGLSWSLEAEGMLSLGASSGTKNQLPGAIRAASLAAEFKTAFLFSDRGNDAAAATKSVNEEGAMAAQLAAAAPSGLQYFEVNATATFAMGYDPISDGPIFELRADLSFSYPCTLPMEASAIASINNLGGRNGLSLPHIEIQLTLACNASPEEPQLAFKASAQDVTVGGFNLGSVTIVTSAYVRPKEMAAAPSALGEDYEVKSVDNDADDKEEWYWKGIITADVSFSTPGSKGDLGATVFFNTLTNDFKVVATFTIETDAVLIELVGEHATYCEESGTFFKGTATFKPDVLPFPLPPIVLSATKYCKPYLPNTYVFAASLDINELSGIHELVDSQAPSPSPSEEEEEEEHLTSAADMVQVRVTLSQDSDPEAVHHIITGIKADLDNQGLIGATAEVMRSITMNVLIDGIDSETWDTMSAHFVHELSERMACEPEDISIAPVKIVGGVELIIVVVQMQRVPFSAHDALLGAARRERMGKTFGIAGAMGAAAKAANMRESPRIKIGNDPSVVTNITTVAVSSAAYSHVLSDSLMVILDSHGAKSEVTVMPRSASMPVSNSIPKLGSAKLDADWLTFKEVIISLKGRKLAATDSDDKDNLVWELKVSGGVEFTNTASSPVPSFLPIEMKVDLDYESTWLGAGVKKSVTEVLATKDKAMLGDGTRAMPCAGRGLDGVGAACGANVGVCPLGLACVSSTCSDPMHEYEGSAARDEALALVDEAYSYNANHSCSEAEDLEVASVLMIQAELLWEMDGFRLWGTAHFSVPCTTGEHVFHLLLDLDKWVIQMVGVNVEMRLPCGQEVERHTQLFSIVASAKKLAVWKFSMTDIAIHMEGFSRKAVEEGGVKLQDMYFRGMASGHIHISSAFDTMGTVKWDTLADTVELGLEMHFAQYFGSAYVEMNAVGTIVAGCKELGDLTLVGEAMVTGIPKIGEAYGKATLLSDCGGSFLLEIELSWKQTHVEMDGFTLAVPEWVLFRVVSIKEEDNRDTSLMIAIPFGRKAVIRMTMWLPFDSIGFQIEFYFEKGTLCDALADLLSLIPVLNIDPCGFLRNGNP